MAKPVEEDGGGADAEEGGGGVVVIVVVVLVVLAVVAGVVYKFVRCVETTREGLLCITSRRQRVHCKKGKP